jgi:putative spermidine/putrescine transport system permease protein
VRAGGFCPPAFLRRRTPGEAVLRNNSVIGWLLASPLTLVLLIFLVAPIAMIFVVSFWGATEWSIYPAFQFDNYEFLLTSDVTY